MFGQKFLNEFLYEKYFPHLGLQDASVIKYPIYLSLLLVGALLGS